MCSKKISKNIQDALTEAVQIAVKRLHADSTIIYIIKKGEPVAVAWNGCEPDDLQISTYDLLAGIDAVRQGTVNINPDEDSHIELQWILKIMGGKYGKIIPLYSNDIVFGIWLITSNNRIFFQEENDFWFQKITENINLIIQSEQLSMENKRCIHEAKTVSDVSLEITQLLGLDRILEIIVEQAWSLLDADICYIGLVDEDEKVIRPNAHYGGSSESLHISKYGEMVGGWVAANRKPLLINNIYKEISPMPMHVLEFVTNEGIISEICVPMLTQRGVIGVLYALSRQEAAFNQSQVDVLLSLGNQAAIAIENSRLYSEQIKVVEKLTISNSVHKQLMNLVLDDQGTQAILDTLSRLLKSPLVVENNKHEVMFWSSEGVNEDTQSDTDNYRKSISELWNNVESMNWYKNLRTTKRSMRVFPTSNIKDDHTRVIMPIVAGSELLGFLSAIEIDGPLNDIQYSALEEATIIIALEFVTQDTARASMLPLLIEAQEEERKRIARELHDETSQALSALMMNLDLIGMDIMENPDTSRQRLVTTKAIAEGMLVNIHRLISKLRPSQLDDLGLIPVITWYCEQRLKPVGILYKIECQGLEQRLPSAIEVALYRIVQEGITNVVRHADASTVTIRIISQNGNLFLSLKDDGIGFNPQILLQSDKVVDNIGLWGIRERVKIVKGDFYIKSHPGKGTELEIRVPINQVEMENA